MKIIGINGWSEKFDDPATRGHDAAAVLLVDGRVVAGIEEERLTRVKHTGKIPISAIRFCLNYGNYSIRDIDYIAISISESSLNVNIKLDKLYHPEQKTWTGTSNLIFKG
ncbi:carbamoyltransferase N-terminal domain-containing protein [Cohnella faecalis]|uniref:Carbamoyltransferase domain-containing protein n=1 Tax=Cohnella faecalis TaxID=2315694 RepID=A0A398CYQ6_9BACL|nr:carbamoyltransferase N-terminal domain-containing protein [Cohnella faecalis]RIE04967.1 hypothetical protein D3H35_03250 [Cohnella faecalis]